MKRHFALLVLLLLIATFAACGRDTRASRSAVVAELRILESNIRTDPNDKASLAKIVAILKGDWPFARTNACVTLRELGPLAKDAVDDLRAALISDDRSVNSEAAIALGEIGPDARAAVPDLAATMIKRNGRIAEFCAVSLGQIGEASPVAMEALERAEMSDNKVKSEAASNALARLKGSRVETPANRSNRLSN